MKRRSSVKFRILRAAKKMRRGLLLAHHTSTLPGIAAWPASKKAVRGIQRFKQRTAPFLLLADSFQTAIRWARYIPAPLRLSMRKHWPGCTTFIFPARPGLPSACYARGCIAIRVDADRDCQKLAAACGGIIISSSLNKKDQPLKMPTHGLSMRWHRHIGHVLSKKETADHHASTLLRWRAGTLHQLR